ncbi:hypothetical protein ACMT4L_01765 [Deinococcus sp. A31D244]|uniref:hypothetical protein n=1 Tax=Deinococcus sp. A31D244 TaxID=3397675 RepID=UPI0039DF3069
MALTLTQLRQTLGDMDAPELREVLVALYRASADNKRQLAALLEGDHSGLLDRLETELEKAFRTSGRLPTMKVGGAKKALTAYLKVAAPADALDAELRYVEAGVLCLHAYGDWPENNYSSMEGVFEAALKRAATLDLKDIPFKRLERLVSNAGGFGYGFSDQIAYQYDEFLEKLEEPEE